MGNYSSSPMQAAKAMISGPRKSTQQVAKASGPQQAKAMVPTLPTGMPVALGGGRKRRSMSPKRSKSPKRSMSPKRSSKKSPKRKVSKSRSLYSKLKRFVGLRGGARKLRSPKRKGKKVSKSPKRKVMKGKKCQRGGC